MATIALDRPLSAASQPGTASRRTAGDWSAMTDAEIMLRVRDGDDAGYDILIQKYHKPIINFMFRMVHNQAVAEELAQEVFLRVYRSRQTYRAEAKFTTWLYRIATNLGVNHARDTKYERTAQNVYLDQPDPETGTTPDVADVTASVEESWFGMSGCGDSQACDGVAGAAADCRADAQVSGHGLQADWRGAEVERVGYEVAAFQGLPDVAGTLEGFCLSD